MLLRIALIVALVAGLASAALNFIKVRDKISTLQTNLRTQTQRADSAELDLNKTKEELKETADKLKDVETELTSARTERDSAVAEAETQRRQSTALTDQLRKARLDLGDAQAELAAWKASGVQPEQVKEVLAQLKQAQTDRALLDRKLKDLDLQYSKAVTELKRYKGETEVTLPPGLVGKVLVVDPKYNFVVLDVGQDHSVQEYGKLLVSRNGKLVARVQVRSVDRDRSIANVMPGWQLSDIMEGDTVLP